MRYAMLSAPLIAAALVAVAASPVFTADPIRTVPVHFKAGANSATIKGKIKGYETVDYVLEASKGQQMNVSMATDNGTNYFNILPPGENEVGIFNGSTNGNQYEGTLPKSGDYKIRVYMMRSAARRNEVANYRLEMIVTGAAQKAPAGAPAGRAELDTTDLLDKCRAYAASKLRVSPGVINVRYQGQRTDGTHAVNGDAESNPPVTFQCSFNPAGKKIADFIINEPHARSGNASPAKPAGTPKATPSKDEQACLQAVSIKTNNGDVILLGTETSEANTTVTVGVGPQRAPWRCLVSGGVVDEVMSMTDEGRL